MYLVWKGLLLIQYLYPPIEAEPEFIRNVQNSVYRISLAGGAAILRLTNIEHRSREEIQQELDWVSHLANSGCNVARVRSMLSCCVYSIAPIR